MADAGVMKGNEWNETREGTPQGAGISPLLANIFLHDVLDLWVHQWRGRAARGRVCVVRYADDFVLGFQYESDARRVMATLRERMEKFGQTLHAGKPRHARLTHARRLGLANQASVGLETFDFLGFTYYCGWTREGRFILKRKTQRKKLTASLTRLRGLAKRRMHNPVAEQCQPNSASRTVPAEQCQWLSRVLRGHYGYDGVRCNYRSLRSFYREICRTWYRALRRRSRCGMTWQRFNQILANHPLLLPRITQTY